MVPENKTYQDLLQQTIERFWESIPPVWTQIRENVRGTAAESFDISVEQFHVLRLIHRGARSVSELAATKKISRPAISQSVDAMVNRGLVLRRPSLEDRRFIGLELTPAGAKTLDAIFEKNHRWMRQKMARLNPDELEAILTGLHVLRTTFIDHDISADA
jgi:DNA-binding MarR family transcriptional regulator